MVKSVLNTKHGKQSLEKQFIALMQKHELTDILRAMCTASGSMAQAEEPDSDSAKAYTYAETVIETAFYRLKQIKDAQ